MIGCDSSDATFYTITATPQPPEAGDITPQNGAAFEEDVTVQFAATPKPGWLFLRWEGGLQGSENPLQTVMESNLDVVAVFERQLYSLDVRVEGEGTVEQLIVETASKTDYPFETIVQLTANPASGWRFDRWEEDLTSNENPIMLTVQDDMDVTAVFIPAVPTEELLAYYPFEGSADDVYTGRHNGVVTGATPAADRFGKENSAFAFDGIDDQIVIPHTPGIDLGGIYPDYTVAFWVNALAPPPSRLLEKWDELNSTPYPIGIGTDTEFVSGFVYDGSVRESIPIGNVWDGQWHHIAYSFDGTTSTFSAYFDGQLVTAITISLSGPTNNTSSIYIGAGKDINRYFRGGIDDIVIYGRVLLEEEISRLHDSSN